MDTNIPKTENPNPIRLLWSHGELNLHNAESFVYHVLSNKEDPTKVNKIVAEKGKNVYVGAQDESPLCNNYLVIRNRRTNTLRWCKTKSFLMQPYSLKSKEKKEPAPEENESKREAMVKLNKAMGSKKVKRQLIEAEKVSVTLDNIEEKVKTAIKSEELVVEKPQNLSFTTEMPSYLPPRNEDAISVGEVYKVYDLISPDILASLDKIAEDIMNSDVLKLAVDDRLTSFFMKCYPLITKMDTTRIKLLLFADNLMKFLKEQAKTVKTKQYVVCNYSSALNKKILDEFCTYGLGNVRTRPSTMRDKAFCYIMVILFLISNFTVDIGLFSGIVPTVDFLKFPMLMRAIGATKERESASVFRLKLPLAELPTLRAKRKSNAHGKKR